MPLLLNFSPRSFLAARHPVYISAITSAPMMNRKCFTGITKLDAVAMQTPAICATHAPPDGSMIWAESDLMRFRSMVNQMNLRKAIMLRGE